MYILERYQWPGNIRELRNVIERATILAEGEFIEPRHLPPTLVVPRRGNPADGYTVARHDRGRGGAAPDPADAGPHAQQQDARRRDPRHQPEDAAQQAESDEGRRSGTGDSCAKLTAERCRRSAREPVSIKAKQVAGVTTLVVVVVAVMSAWHMVTVTRLRLQEAQSVAQLLADAMFQRVFDVVNAGPHDPYAGDPAGRRPPRDPRTPGSGRRRRRATCSTPPSSGRTGRSWRTARRTRKAVRGRRARGLLQAGERRAAADAAAGRLLRAPVRGAASRSSPGTSRSARFGSACRRCWSQNELRDRPDPCGLDRADRAGRSRPSSRRCWRSGCCGRFT